MCGIVGYVGGRPARDVITKGLKRLEYRGYDSAGFAAVNGDLQVFKTKGRVAALEAMIPDSFAMAKGAFAKEADLVRKADMSRSADLSRKTSNEVQSSGNPGLDHDSKPNAPGTSQNDVAESNSGKNGIDDGVDRELSIFEEDEFAHLRENPTEGNDTNDDGSVNGAATTPDGGMSHPDDTNASRANGQNGAHKGAETEAGAEAKPNGAAGTVERGASNGDLNQDNPAEHPNETTKPAKGDDSSGQLGNAPTARRGDTDILNDASRAATGSGAKQAAFSVNNLHPDSHFVNISGTRQSGNDVWAALGHTRWATHGEPNDVNAHPHTGNGREFALVHNGIIENYASLRTELERKGHVFVSQTDTEVLAHLIEEIDRVIEEDFVTAVQQALSQVEGTYGIVIVHRDMPGALIAARKGSPLLLGVGDGEFFVASDASPIIEYTQQVVYLDDEEMAVITPTGYEVRTTRNVPIRKEVHQLAMDLQQIEKGGYEHFMLKEIFEQPRALADCMRGRLLVEEGRVQLGGLEPVMDKLLGARRILIAACGTSWHSALVGEYLIEALARIPVEVAYASEFRYSDPIVNEDDVLIVVSQSGETADTLAAMREAKSKGATVIGVVNVVGSTIARETDAGVYIHAGPEIGVASTKAFTAQVTVLTMIALHLAQHRGTLAPEEFTAIVRDLAAVPEMIKQILEQNEQIADMTRTFTYAPNFLYLGRSFNFPVALEGALKLKEISYIHAEGYPAAEMKHGPIALIDEHMPVVVLATADHVNEKMISNIEEVRARKGRIISVTTADNAAVAGLSEFMISVPACHDAVTPLLSVIPLQLISYHIAVARKCNVDMPRNLAKSVTVE